MFFLRLLLLNATLLASGFATQPIAIDLKILELPGVRHLPDRPSDILALKDVEIDPLASGSVESGKKYTLYCPSPSSIDLKKPARVGFDICIVPALDGESVSYALTAQKVDHFDGFVGSQPIDPNAHSVDVTDAVASGKAIFTPVPPNLLSTAKLGEPVVFLLEYRPDGPREKDPKSRYIFTPGTHQYLILTFSKGAETK